MRIAKVLVVVRVLLASVLVLGVTVWVAWFVFIRPLNWTDGTKENVRVFAAGLASGIGQVEEIRFEATVSPVGVFTGSGRVFIRPADGVFEFTQADVDRFIERLASVGWQADMDNCWRGDGPGTTACPVTDRERNVTNAEFSSGYLTVGVRPQMPIPTFVESGSGSS